MANIEIELNPIDFITVGTVGPKGRRQFYLQAGGGTRIISLTIEKEQARALSEAINEMVDDLAKRPDKPTPIEPPVSGPINMDLREPIDPQFRVGQMGLGYDEDRDLIILVAQEVSVASLVDDEDDDDEESNVTGPSSEESGATAHDPSVVRIWATRQQMRALSDHAMHVVRQGRVDPQSNGRLLYYWT